MDFISANWILILVALISGIMLFGPMLKGGVTGGDSSLAIGAQSAVQLLNRSKAQVIDLRSADDFAAGHIAKAKQMELKNLEEQLPKLVKKQTTPVVFVCTTGTTASKAASKAKALGYESSQFLSGGMPAWVEAKMPVEKS